MKCVVCGHNQYEQLLSLPCGNLDGSVLYDTVTATACKACGHIFNVLSEEDKNGIAKYYEEEYSPSNLQSPNTEGDIPGSSNKNSIRRYLLLYDFIRPYLGENDKILDVGCATGGFLKFLKENYFTQLCGIDCSHSYVIEAQKVKGLEIKQGSAEEIPFGDDPFDFVIADQVVEHLFDPNIFFSQIRRVLKKDGYFCICVPNAMLYLENYFFDFYWFLMREHVQHFDTEHLSLLGNRNGFSVEDIVTTSSEMLSKEVMLPNLCIIFRYHGPISITEAGQRLKEKTQLYIEKSYEGLKQQQRVMNKLCELQIPFYVWGVSREFLYLYDNTDLKKCNILGLIDDIPTKQLHTVNGMKIVSSEVVKELSKETAILITAYAHVEVMKKKLKQLGFKGKVYE